MNLFDMNINNGGTSYLMRDGSGFWIAIVGTAVTVAPVAPVAVTYGVVSRPSGADDWDGNSFTPTVRGHFVLSVTVGAVARRFNLIACDAAILELPSLRYETNSAGVPTPDRTRRIEDRHRILRGYLNEHQTTADITAFTHATPAAGLAGVPWKAYGA